MKVFLSHSTKDAAFVARLAAGMTANGFEPWRCEVGVEKNVNFVARIEEGLGACDVALLIWSPEAAASKWTTQEWTSALHRELGEQRMRLGIVMLREHPLPELLRTKNYITVGADEQAAVGETIDWLKRRETAQRLSGLKAPVYLPEYRPQDFVGRTSYLQLLNDTLINEPTAFLLHGEPGAGKSMLALRFAWDAQKDFDAVIFQTCGQRSVDTITAELAERLPIDVKTQPPDKQREAAKDWLRRRQSLLVLDDVWSTEVKQLEPGPGCSVLYTSRLRSLPWVPPAQSAKVEKFTEAESVDLFHAYLDSVFGEQEVNQQRVALLGFAGRVEMLPIAVAVGASLLREKEASALGRAVLKLRLDALADGTKDVNALFRTAIESQPEREQKLLAACAACVQDSFWLPLAAQIAELNQEEAEDAADRLVHSSLLRVADRDRQRFQLHALLRDQLRERLAEDGLLAMEQRHAAALERLFTDWETRWKDCRECLEEVIPAARLLWEQGESERAWQLGYWAFSLGSRVGELDTALRLMQQQELFFSGRDDYEAKNVRQASYGNQALILKDWGRLEEALALHKKKEALCLELGNKASLAISFGNQALILTALGRLEEALALHKKEEALCLKLGDKGGVQASFGNQALILEALGQPKEAMALHKKEEAICLELGNKDGLQTGYGNQALILEALGRLEAAVALYKKKEGICLELGNKSSLGNCYWNWGLLARAQGDKRTGKQKLEQALAIFTELKMPRERDAVQAELDKLGD
jgi:tetratricopeptide (TPR) repeat protein